MSALFLLLGVCVGGFVGMMGLGCGKQVLGVRAAKTRAPCVPRATQGLRARSGSEPLCGSAWFGSVWGGFLGGILGGIARAGFSHRESALPDPLNY